MATTQQITMSTGCIDKFTPALGEAIEEFMELAKPFSLNPSKRQSNNYRSNNYRKIHHIPMRRKLRCRRASREGWRVWEGLSPGVVVLDETEERVD
ncbi:MAG: hypothetical protein WA125_16630 [Desulfosporosinus sp.]